MVLGWGEQAFGPILQKAYVISPAVFSKVEQLYWFKKRRDDSQPVRQITVSLVDFQGNLPSSRNPESFLNENLQCTTLMCMQGEMSVMQWFLLEIWNRPVFISADDSSSPSVPKPRKAKMSCQSWSKACKIDWIAKQNKDVWDSSKDLKKTEYAWNLWIFESFLKTHHWCIVIGEQKPHFIRKREKETSIQ